MRQSIPLIMLAMLLLGIAATAYPNLGATSGILAIPTAMVAPSGDSQWAADALFQNDTTLNGRIVYGMTGSIEVGAGAALDGDTQLGVNGKMRLGSLIGGFDWAVGATVVTGGNADGWQLYATGTREIPWGSAEETKVFGTIGVSFTDIDIASSVRPFVGAQLQLGTGTEIAGEFVFETGDFTDSISTLLVRQRFNDAISIQAGFTNAFGFVGSQDHDLFVGIAFTGR